jgi:hypothetical protein
MNKMARAAADSFIPNMREELLQCQVEWTCSICDAIFRYDRSSLLSSEFELRLCPCCEANRTTQDSLNPLLKPCDWAALPQTVSEGVTLTLRHCETCDVLWHCEAIRKNKKKLWKCPSCRRDSKPGSKPGSKPQDIPVPDDTDWRCSGCNTLWRGYGWKTNSNMKMESCVCCPIGAE